MGVLIDTSVLIGCERQRLDLGAVVEAHAEDSFVISAITASELLHGVHRAVDPGQRSRRSAWVEALLAQSAIRRCLQSTVAVCSRKSTRDRTDTPVPPHGNLTRPTPESSRVAVVTGTVGSALGAGVVNDGTSSASWMTVQANRSIRRWNGGSCSPLARVGDHGVRRGAKLQLAVDPRAMSMLELGPTIGTTWADSLRLTDCASFNRITTVDVRDRWRRTCLGFSRLGFAFLPISSWRQKLSYPDSRTGAVRSWQNNWDSIATFFDFPEEIRRLIYTTNSVEGYSRQMRRVTKTKSSFPTPEAARKLLYLATRDVTTNWRGSLRDWAKILNQLAIRFEGRVPA